MHEAMAVTRIANEPTVNQIHPCERANFIHSLVWTQAVVEIELL
jgi:hypothetical protein